MTLRPGSAGGPVTAVELDLDDLAPLRHELFAIGELVLVALREDHLRVGVDDRRLGTQPVCRLERERCQMRALEMPAEISGRQPQGSVALLHRFSP